MSALAVSLNERIPSPSYRVTNEYSLEKNGGVEHCIDSYCAAYKPFDFGIVVDGKDSVEEEKKGDFNGKYGREIHDFGRESKLCQR